MKQQCRYILTLTAAVAMGTLAACSSAPTANTQLDQARSDYRAAQDNPQARELASVELRQAADALNQADAAWTRRDLPAEVDHWAYLARQRIAIAQETGQQKAAEQAVANANQVRDQLRLAARTSEVDVARRSADVAQQQASSVQVRNSQLEAQLKALNAKPTDRGMVITIDDVLFDTGGDRLKSGGLRGMDRLVAFLKAYPQRKAMVEGFTDSVGSDAHNQALSDRRAEAVRTALVGMGIGSERLTSQGYGEAHPVAGNDSAGGRQMNRRVEIVLSDDSGTIAPR
ncbi:outer membrane protein OmpA-like peptidoglycan-associated protein [Sphaerotilus hippei]|uniref:Outer membrane protein OmpA-like peptidoglycan-associated protein n=1 Tax=Sphaerotilus hippei TaxID=744406 RepID=A0A318GXE9_9BURK|nr:OmpA family protein [Sphaerotilus hippei]PXW94423.1 outer membrane protein OmpA-like peptidoglycan-associated protein [Sphaerotilus hippei]